jgi:DNA topoisomerase VI subunit B
MSTPMLHRATFETSRAAEYFTIKELPAQTGQELGMFAMVTLKEAGDNGIDAAEAAGVAPAIVIELALSYGDDRIRLAVQDNGGGIPPETVRRVLNFDTRTSDKSAYRSPLRGAQGNALKTILGMQPPERTW